jgi:hypothetical protein
MSRKSEMSNDDMIGMRFGKLTVSSRVVNSGSHSRWLCKCDCGGNKVVAKTRLVWAKHPTRDCGCVAKAELDITGCRFGKLVAVRLTEEISNNNKVWLCKCDCGNEIKLGRGRLMYQGAAARKSCGCSVLEGRENRAYRIIYNGYIASARARSLQWLLTFEEFKLIIIKNCNYCGSEPSAIKKIWKSSRRGELDPSHKSLLWNGIDRID